MPGYLFTFSETDSLKRCIEQGVYSTYMNPKWSMQTSATFADFATMKPGDNVYFFSKRKVFGIGEIVEIEPGKPFLDNFKGASRGESPESSTELLTEYASATENQAAMPQADGKKRIQRWIIAFKPAPYFFSEGVDMDDLLASNPFDFRSLRVFWKRSFIKFDEAENTAFKTALLRANRKCLHLQSPNLMLPSHYDKNISKLRSRNDLAEFQPDYYARLSSKRNENGSLGSEMDLEAGILFQLAQEEKSATDAFGSWDYLSHQVHASPMKAVDYMDRMDIFGYSLFPNSTIINRYCVAELKKGTVTSKDLPQLMKYVDWIKQEYAGGSYDLIRAFLVGYKFDMKDICRHLGDLERVFLPGRHSSTTAKWNDVTFVKYEVEKNGHIKLTATSCAQLKPSAQ